MAENTSKTRSNGRESLNSEEARCYCGFLFLDAQTHALNRPIKKILAHGVARARMQRECIEASTVDTLGNILTYGLVLLLVSICMYF